MTEETRASHPITRWLEKANPAVFSAYAIFAAFMAYFSMYAFRKPFSVALFSGKVALPLLPPMDYKILLIIAQVFGYTLSKFTGIKVISEMEAKHRAFALIGMIAVAEGALLLFAITPRPYNAFFLFVNGIPLGMVWGLVFGFLEGRRLSELLGAGLSASYIVASGFVKTAGASVMKYLHVSEFWMPFVTGMLFLPLFLLCVWMLQLMPPPTKEDEELRTKRVPMKSQDRWAFFRRFSPGLLALMFLYVFLTAYRDFRDNFAKEIWKALKYDGQPMIFTQTEIYVAFGVMIALAMLMLIKNNRRAMVIVHVVMLFGSVMIGVSTWAFQAQMISPVAWMTLVGLGLYLGYVPYGCVLFDRLIAAIRFAGTAGFMIYLADSFGYLGSVGLMLYKNFGQPNLAWLKFFVYFSYITSILCSVCFVFSLFYFFRVASHVHGPDEGEGVAVQNA
ncbi:MAG: hypothetical protein H6727_07170 [Myxococcales bacterium]|nr:hypothetical protein [Myxococcales bacterium]